ncbi:uncharacterized protein [Parasteatoda tepidariorum]|uniref:uncharacterized protein isoform X2 n=1 Tax=Parasteatoda tepidariorum TaxID=114398 RepID=UPI001C728D64|nr:uncharacterized protein LOC110283246 isoform X2 [Parasteatoda tepidariorum]
MERFWFHLLLCSSSFAVGSITECERSKYLCSGACPPLPQGIQLKSESICLRDTDTDACVCWLNNPSSQLQSVFRCEAKINGSAAHVICNAHEDCFNPDPDRPVCMIILQCNCLDIWFPNEILDDRWKRVRAIIHTKEIYNSHNADGSSVEKVQEEVREFRLKHLLFLLGFVIAPLLCWCLLNFFHEGKCRKKAPNRPEAQPIPTSRCSTIDNMNNNDDSCGERSCEDVVVVPLSPPARSSFIRCSQSVPSLLSSAPEDLENSLENTTAQQQTLLKFESPPPYTETMERTYIADLGPPPAYEDAIRGTDINIQQLWQTVFILEPGAPGGERT